MSKVTNIFDLLVCPDCGQKLEVKKDSLYCKTNKRKFKKKDSVYILLPKEEEKLLYP